jgi:dienelactone hydrolase
MGVSAPLPHQGRAGLQHSAGIERTSAFLELARQNPQAALQGAGWTVDFLFGLARNSRLVDAAAVAFYPTSCDEQRQQPSWSTTIPLMVLIGAEDVGIPAVPCKAILDGAVSRGAKVEMQIPGRLSPLRLAQLAAP